MAAKVPAKKRKAKKQAAKPRKRARAAAPSRPDRYAAHVENMAARSRQASEKGRDIGQIPPIANIDRRAACQLDLKLFGLTYFRAALETGGEHWDLCRDQEEAIERIQESTLAGALYALGMARGFSKTTWIRIGALWALANAHRRYPFIIGATEPKAVKNLTAIKSFIRFGQEFAADFPEMSYPVQRLAGVTQKAAGQLLGGESTLIRWDNDEIVLPSVPPPSNWPKSWPLRADGRVPTSGSCVSVSGLTGEGIRGSLMTLSTSEQLRPDLVLIDDPQTRESASSRSQNRMRIELVSGDVLGMAGPGQKIAATMLCTPIYPGDMADVMLDRKQHPLWRGDRRPMMRSLPKHMDLWDSYFAIYARCAQLDPPDFTEANAHYAANRQQLDEGAEAAWEHCYDHETEISAVQSAMHLYFRDPRAFMAERQLAPLDPTGPAEELPKLTKEAVMARTTSHAKGTVPAWATTLTFGMDVHDALLYYCVSAWGDGFRGAIVEYGTWPKQGRLYFSKRDANPTIQEVTKISDVKAAIYAAIKLAVMHLCGREWKNDQGATLRISQGLIDCGYVEEVVYRACRESEHAAVLLASRGYGIGSGKAPMSEWRRIPGERRQPGPVPTWTIRISPGKGRHCLFEANHWKTHLLDRLLVPMGDASALTLHAGDHRMLADHFTAEYRERTSNDRTGRKVDEWQEIPGQDNHFWDVAVSSAVAASLQGVTLTPNAPKPQRPAAVNVASEQAAAKAAVQKPSVPIGLPTFEEVSRAAAAAQQPARKQGEKPKLSIADEVRQRRLEFEARRRRIF